MGLNGITKDRSKLFDMPYGLLLTYAKDALAKTDYCNNILCDREQGIISSEGKRQWLKASQLGKVKITIAKVTEKKSKLTLELHWRSGMIDALGTVQRTTDKLFEQIEIAIEEQHAKKEKK